MSAYALRTAVALAAGAALCLSAPLASASDRDTPVQGVKISSAANAATRAIAEKEPLAAIAAATVCGTGYELYNAEPLPDLNTRQGTLFTYDNGGLGPGNSECAILDNNTASAKWMKIQLCENKATSPRCDVDQGNYSDYAGPVFMNNCPTVTALMKTTSGSSSYIINAVRGSFCD
ncbi:hypothetical protein ITX44_26515 [Streptomyces sp. KK5PA1]|uniref:Uncharacterized protein n=2 Tax=Actinacidiphila acididurans TaxID=2784346 RepID=A0ABS2TXH1_9ACTN|nr:hypothetical protein [Actinacidiphila acididurans]